MSRRTIVPLQFGSAEQVRFGWYHPALGTPRGNGVVLCNPIGDDYIRAHRSIRHWAEALASAGHPVLRFDFHGTGDSSGDEGDPARVETWLADIDLAVAELRRASGVASICIGGLRLGGTLAAVAASRRSDIDAVMLWGAYPTGRAYVADTTKVHKMHRMLEPDSFAIEPKERTVEGEEALGFFLSAATIAELDKIDLLALTVRPAAKVLVIGTGNVPAEEPLLAHLRALGAETDFRHLPGHKFLIMIPHRSAVPTPIIQSTVEWLAEKKLGVPVQPVSPVPPPAPAGDRPALRTTERPLFFGKDDSLFGILHEPAADQRQAKRPAIVMLNAGTVHRIGPHRFYVRMARRWAALGFYVFRIDLSGIGDSPAIAGAEENLCYPPNGIADAQTAMAALREQLQLDRFILTGLCSGADIAFQAGFQDRRVAGAVMMNPRTFCVNDLEMVETYKKARYYQDSLFKKEKWLKLVRGEVDLRRAAGMLLPKVKSVVMRKVESLLRSEPAAAVVNNDVPACLRMMAERGVDTFLVATEHDPGVDYVDVHFGPKMRALSGVSGYRRSDFKGTDHTFTSLFAQELVSNTITSHFTERYLSS